MARKKRKMTEAERFAARCFLAESDLASLQMTVVGGRRRELLRELDPEGRLEQLEAKQRELAGTISLRKGEFETLMQKLADRLGVGRTGFSWDDETGEIKILGDEEC